MIKTRLHILMAEKRINQQELSKVTGIGKNTISRYFNDTYEKINKKDIDVLCKFFKCTPNDIFEFTNEDNEINKLFERFNKLEKDSIHPSSSNED